MHQINGSYKDDIFEFTYKPKLLNCENIYFNDYYSTYGRNLLVCFFNSGDTVRIVVYNINKDIYIYEDSYYEDSKDDHTINQYIGLLENTLFISTQNTDNNNLQLFLKYIK